MLPPVIVCVLVLLIISDNNFAIISVISIISLGIILLSVPIFLQENASFFVSYYPAGEVYSVLNNYHIDMSRKGQLISYLYWPAIHLFSASNMLILNVELESLLKYIPLFWVIAFVLLTYSIARSIGLRLQQWVMMAWLLLCVQWIGQYYYSAQSLAILIYLIVISIVFREKITWEYALLFIIVICSLIITHSLTSFAVIVGVSIMSTYKKRVRVVAILSVTIFLMFYLYLSKNVFDYGVQQFIGKLLSGEPNLFWKSSEFNSHIESYSKLISHYSKSFFAISYIFFLILAVLALYKNHKRWSAEQKRLFYFAGLWMQGILTLLIFQYGTEMQYRVYLYATIIITFLLVLSYPRSKMLIFYAVFLTLVHFPAHYGTYSYEQTLETELCGAKFLAYQVKPQISYSYRFYPYVRYYEPENLFVRCLTFAPQYAQNLNKDLISVQYISDSLQSNNYMNYAFEHDAVRDWIRNNNQGLVLLYNNGLFWTYKNQIIANSKL